jgi:tetratricopeptide (TPR) repeat protein
MVIAGYQTDKKELLLILSIFAISLFFRVAYFIDYKNTAVFPVLAASDGDFYYQRAVEISGGDIFTAQAFAKWPFYAYFLAFLFKISAANITLVYMLQFLLGAFNSVLLYFVTRRLFNKSAGFIAGLLYATYGLFIFYEGLLIYTSLSLFLNLLFFLLILRLNDGPPLKGLFWLGMLLGVCTLAQGNIIIFGLPVACWIIWRKSAKFAKFILNFLTFSIGLVLILGMLALRSYILDKDLVLLTGNTGLNFYIGNNSGSNGTLSWPGNLNFTADGMLRDARAIAQLETGKDLSSTQVSGVWFNKSMDFIRNKPADYFRLLVKKTVYLFSPGELIFEPEYATVSGKIRIFKMMFTDLYFIMPFALLGMFLNLRNIRKLALPYSAVVILAASIILFFVQTKFRIMLVPFFIIFAASAIYAIGGALRNKKILAFIILLLSLIVLLILLNLQPKRAMPGNQQQSQVEFQEHFSKAIDYEKAADYPAALNELNAASRIKSSNHNIVYALGVIYYNLGHLDEAEKKFKQAAFLYPFFAEAYYNLGFLYNQTQRFDEAIGVLKKTVYLERDDLPAHFELSRAYKAKGMFIEAEQELNYILEKTKNRPADKKVIEKALVDLSH